MNDLLRQRILRRLEALEDDRAYQVLDYIEFLESRYGQRAAQGGIFNRISETVEDTMRAGRLPVKAITGTMGIMDGAAKLMRGVVAAGQAAVDEAVKVAEEVSRSPEPPVEPGEPPAPRVPPGDAAEG